MQPFGIWKFKWANWHMTKPSDPLELSRLIQRKTRRKNAQEARTMTEDEGTTDKKEEETKEEEKLEEEEKVVSPHKTKSQKAREAKKEELPVLPQDLPYPKVPTKKNKEHYFKRFLEIFKRLEITFFFFFLSDAVTRNHRRQLIKCGGFRESCCKKENSERKKEPEKVWYPNTQKNLKC